MRRSGVIAGLVASVALAPSMALASPPPEMISGSGTVLATQYSLSVSGGPFGQDPTGSIDLAGVYDFHGTATCMSNGGQDDCALTAPAAASWPLIGAG